MDDKFLSAQKRKWVYGIAIAALPLLVFYGIIEESSAPLWAALVGGILVPSLAFANTPAKRDPDDQG